MSLAGGYGRFGNASVISYRFADISHTIPASQYVIGIQNGDVNTFAYIACVELLAVQGSEGWVPILDRVPIYTDFLTGGTRDLLGPDCLRLEGTSMPLHQHPVGAD